MNESAGTNVPDTAGQNVTGQPPEARLGPWSAVAGQGSAPNAPVVSAPADGATGTSVAPTLDVTVTDPDSNPMNVTFYGRPVGRSTPPDFALGVSAGYAVLLGEHPEHAVRAVSGADAVARGHARAIQHAVRDPRGRRRAEHRRRRRRMDACFSGDVHVGERGHAVQHRPRQPRHLHHGYGQPVRRHVPADPIPG